MCVCVGEGVADVGGGSLLFCCNVCLCYHATTGSVLSSRTSSAVLPASLVSMLLSEEAAAASQSRDPAAVLACAWTPKPAPHPPAKVLTEEAAPFLDDQVVL